MVFSSSLFLLVFLPFFLLIYFIVPHKFKNVVALIGSLFFYAWGAPLFVYILSLSLLADFFIVRFMNNSSDLKTRRILLILSVIINIGMLAYFKYANFFVENWVGIFGESSSEWVKIALPIGISFFTFQKMSYSVDVFRKVKEPLENFLDYTLFVILFPQLIAGPIVRFTDLADEIRDRESNHTVDNRLIGFFRFSIGLAKKVIIANILGAEADRVFDTPIEEYNMLWNWYGALMYSLQIYFDFSGYSDMAIGLGRIMGFHFPENFDSPYISRSITEFWRRWHITLGTWMKDYLYIPLGGNKVQDIRLYTNLWTVFLISGLWHGASWNFVIWGAYHGFLLVIERLFLRKFLEKLPQFLSIFITFFLVIIGWVVFKLEDWVTTREFIKAMFSFEFESFHIENYITTVAFLGFIIAFGNSVVKKFKWEKLNYLDNLPKTISVFGITVLLLIASISGITSSGFNPFIYFQF